MKRYVILDRDGTVVRDRHYLSQPEQVELLPWAAEGLRAMQAMGLGLVIATNQSGVGRGMFDSTRLDAIHQRMCDLLGAEGVTLDGIFSCPHVPEDDCDCRKPRTGLVEQASRRVGFRPSEAFVVGDKPSDVELGRRIGATTFLVQSVCGADAVGQGPGGCDYVVDDLRQAARVMARLIENRVERMDG